MTGGVAAICAASAVPAAVAALLRLAESSDELDVLAAPSSLFFRLMAEGSLELLEATGFSGDDTAGLCDRTCGRGMANCEGATALSSFIDSTGV